MPYEQSMSLNQYIDIIEGKTTSKHAHYISLQNGSLPAEFSLLQEDVDEEITWCSEALGKSPDAVNFWFGDEKSITSLHKDPYENCYAVVRGQKTFVLLPPTEYYCMHGQLELIPSGSHTPWIPVDPLHPDLERFPRFKHAHPIIVTVKEGDMLYLPALWFHQVLQQGENGVIAINYWYDMDYSNTIFPSMGLFRGLVAGVMDGQSDFCADNESSSEEGQEEQENLS
ncbi:JmjC domain-containing protein 7 [Apophysomyces ossiformis]|uniref:JmjC domain-containing protein 7 n=1 Tax=Apophysomyces ossiformis TaxID=679940 RepID=A0A8H7BVL8_9FUNG|nr:JmjC domain-containing protein 7 [Apophysomyces ossiformis]